MNKTGHSIILTFDDRKFLEIDEVIQQFIE